MLLSGCFLLGGIVGCLFSALSDGQGAQELSAYLEDYLLLAGEGGVSGGLWPVLWERVKVLLAALILGATAFFSGMLLPRFWERGTTSGICSVCVAGFAVDSGSVYSWSSRICLCANAAESWTWVWR